MIKFFSRFKIIFYLVNLVLIILYIFPGSLLGFIVYDDIKIQPQITADIVISSNHFYVFVLMSFLGIFTFYDLKKINSLFIYLIFLSVILELSHMIIPNRSFQWSDLFGNLVGVIIVFFINILIKKYGIFQK